MADRICHVLVCTLIVEEILLIINGCLCTLCNLCHHLNCLYRIFTGSTLARQHNRTCTIIDCIGYIRCLRTCRTRILDHGIQHLCRCDNLLTSHIYLIDNHLLDNWDFLARNLHTHISTGYHNTIGHINDIVDVVNAFRILDLGNDIDVISTVRI